MYVLSEIDKVPTKHINKDTHAHTHTCTHALTTTLIITHTRTHPNVKEANALAEELLHVVAFEELVALDVLALLEHVDAVHAPLSLGHRAAHTITSHVDDVVQEEVPVRERVLVASFCLVCVCVVCLLYVCVVSA